ncbi:MAG TPA: glycosyltransferase [Bryobacteraceae bacterium]|nr:glycosyltransferase [Bryobacteraceae bacterium]
MRVIFTPWGSFGDLHPYLAVAIEMKKRGHDVLMATSEVYRAKVEGEGLRFHAVRPNIQQFLDHPERFGDLMHPFKGPERIFRGVIMPSIREMFEDLQAGSAGCDLLVSHVAMSAAPVVAEYLSIPWVSVVLQPAVLWSATDPSYFPITRSLLRRSPSIARVLFRVIRADTNTWMRPLYDLRRELGLPVEARHPLFEGQFSPLGTLALFSPLFAKPQPDWPPNTVATGFPFYDKLDAASACLPSEMEEFLQRGEPPIVFTLGTSAVHVRSNFYEVSYRAAEKLGKRAILLAGPNFQSRIQLHATRNILIAEYVPYSQLLPRGAVTVHSGGIGTTAQALRAGKPQIVMPFSHDQPDNANRIRRLEAGAMIPRRSYSVGRLCGELTKSMSSERIISKACELGRQIQAEAGTQSAADALERIMPR